jgi:hypothetical protein
MENNRIQTIRALSMEFLPVNNGMYCGPTTMEEHLTRNYAYPHTVGHENLVDRPSQAS